MTSNLNANINVTRKVNLDLNGKTVTGNVSFVTNESGDIRLGAGQITGNLTVNTPNISFYNAATVSGTTTITDVADKTFTNNGVLNGIVNLVDPNGARFVNNGTITFGLNINTSANVELDGVFNQVKLEGTGKITLDGTIQRLDTEQNVVVEGGTVEVIKGNGAVAFDVKAPAVKIKDNVTYKVSKTFGNEKFEYYGVQARILMPEEEFKDIEAEDKVVVSLLDGEKVLATSTSKKALGDMFVNTFAGEKFYASTLFVPNAPKKDFYPSLSWDAQHWTNAVKPTGLKVEIKRGEKVIYSVTSSMPLNEQFTDGESTEALSWEDILEFNKPVQQGN